MRYRTDRYGPCCNHQGAAPSANTRVYTMLYVEDNPANLMLVEDLIARRPDVTLLSATDGLRGVEIARAVLPDVVLMDINLPGISGIKAMRILADDPTTAHIPVIALSANAMPHHVVKGVEAGFFRYLTKPIKIHEFLAAIDEALAQTKLRGKGFHQPVLPGTPLNGPTSSGVTQPP